MSSGSEVATLYRVGSCERDIGEKPVVTVIVLVKADVGRIRAVAEAVAETDGVSAVYSVAGRYDLVVILEVRTLEDVESAVPGALDKVVGVTSSETLVAFRTYSSTELEAAFDIGVD